MSTEPDNDFVGDEIGPWSELKLEIIKNYALEYSRILTGNKLTHVYIDAFAGAGVHWSKTSGEYVPGSPLNALNIEPSFREFHLIDLDGDKTQHLRDMVGQRQDVTIYHGDCNEVLLDKVLPTLRREHYRRALCLLDPYGLHLDWKVMHMAGQLGTVEIFLNFPSADMNRNVLWRDSARVSSEQAERMTRFWGDESWRHAAYSSKGFFFEDMEEKQSNDAVAEAFRKRLMDVAGFKFVPKPVPMRNTRGVVVYYLFFASPNAVANKTVTYIFDKYRNRRKI